MNNMKAFLGRGALAGLAGGAVAAVFQWTVTEHQIRKALELEAAHATGAHEEMFSRSTQVIGGALGNVLFGLFVGLIFGFASALLWRSASREELSSSRPILTSWLLPNWAGK